MTVKTPERLFDYFTLEANEQLAILEEEAFRETQPDAGRFIAAARRLTESAEMARLTSLAEIASGIERIASDLIRSKIPWTKELRNAVLGGLRELRATVGRVRDLDETDYVRLRRHSREVLAFTREDFPSSVPIPVSKLFYDDAGPHIVKLASEKPISAPSTPEAKSRGRTLKDMLDVSVAKSGGSAQTTAPDSKTIIPVEQLLYRGRAALDRAREIGSLARAQKRVPAEAELSEMFDLIDLAATEAP